MKLWIWTLVPTLAAGILWGCGGPPVIGGDGNGSSASGGKNGNSGNGTGNSSANAGTNGLGNGGGNATCPSSCQALNADCGAVTDTKCGGVVECGTCSDGKVCGAKGANLCGSAVVSCTAKSCADYPDVNCGDVSDGCNGLINCGASCPTGQVCGALTPNHCDNGTSCNPKTCADLKVECGLQGDGCGGTIDCGGCPSGQACGAGGPDKCGAITSCTPKTCADQGIECGAAGDTCGAPLSCGTCPTGKLCGAGGKCVVDNVCKPKTCADKGYDCGTTDDGCGNPLNCGSTCPSGQVCSATSTNRCGVPLCAAKTCKDLGLSCGPAGDGCGNQLDCGTCPSGQRCGGGGAGKCGTSNVCVAKTCAAQNIFCGPAGDTCGASLDCGTCSNGQQCITQAGQTQCVAPVCVPKTCAALGVECGTTGDGCGGVLNCGNSCVSPKICGGDPAKPGKCGCTGVCSQIPNCTGSATTTVSGTVYDPAGLNPLPNALVYVANNPADPGLAPFGTRSATCDVCGATAAGDPLVTATTATDGSFTLKNVPVGQAITLVVQLGRWRKILQVDIPTPCVANSLPNAGKITLPKNKGEGDIPRYAVVTGSADGMECVFWKMGVDTAEFTNPGGTGRVNLYKGSGITVSNKGVASNSGAGAVIDTNTPSETALFVKDTSGNMPLTGYDVAVLSCQGSNFNERATGTATQSKQPSLAYWSDLVNYANNGGRVFASHFSYTYLRQGGTSNAFRGTANWAIDSKSVTSKTASIIVDPTRNPKGQAFANWLALPAVGGLASASNPTLSITDPRWDVASLVAPSQAWMEVDWDNDPTTAANPLHYTFNTPVGGTGSCGRVVYSDFHVSAADATKPFPTSCGSRTNFTAQEKILEYMLFDLSACVTPYKPLCTPKSCAAQGISCGAAGDGCGNEIQCGTCTGGAICGLKTPGVCDTFSCTPTTCAAQGIQCGSAGDGCGNALNCGTCPSGQTCGAGGPGLCGTGCTAQTCQSQNLTCGFAGDTCGGSLSCGTCPTGQTCGGNPAKPGQCGSSCTPTTCSALGYVCGAAGDGCGNALNCGTCPSGQTCGVGGPGKCGTGTCAATTCSALGFNCGAASDGCGNALNCGTCPSGQVCGAGGPNKCGASTCTPRTCAAIGYQCGAAGDGCGGKLDCGVCPTGQTCGAAGPGKCGTASCQPQTCSQQGLQCGLAGDGCGNGIDCGPCPTGQVCGVGGPGKCGVPSCTPKTCGQQGIECGAAGDGCGASLNCGNCPSGWVCGLNSPGKCGFLQ